MSGLPKTRKPRHKGADWEREFSALLDAAGIYHMRQHVPRGQTGQIVGAAAPDFLVVVDGLAVYIDCKEVVGDCLRRDVLRISQRMAFSAIEQSGGLGLVAIRFVGEPTVRAILPWNRPDTWSNDNAQPDIMAELRRLAALQLEVNKRRAEARDELAQEGGQ